MQQLAMGAGDEAVELTDGPWWTAAPDGDYDDEHQALLFLERQLLDTDEWVDTSTELIENEEINTALQQFLVDELFANVDVQGQFASRLGKEKDPKKGSKGVIYLPLASCGKPHLAISKDDGNFLTTFEWNTSHNPPVFGIAVLAFGTVVASYTIEDFSLGGLEGTDREQIDDRWHHYKQAMSF